MLVQCHVFDTPTILSPIVQFWLSGLTFVYGFLMDGAIAVIGLCAMEVVPKSLAGSAHGLACALAQGTYSYLVFWGQALSVDELNTVLYIL